MKVSLRIFRFSRKVVMIVGGVLLLSGVAGATAVYIGKDKLLGSSGDEKTGDLACTSAQVIKIHRKDRVWIRKYIRTEPADGLTRVRTALRVAAAVFAKDKPDLVQVVVLDANGPTARADMNGHAIGADVVYVPHPEKLASLEGTPVLQAKYLDGMATATGEFYGEKMHMPEEDAAHYMASLSEKTDCLDPPAPEGAAKAEGEGGAKKEGEGASKAEKPAGEEGAAKAEASAGEGEAKATEGEAKPEGAPAAEGEAAKPEGAPGEATAAKPEKGWFASIKGMVLGDGEVANETKPAGAGDAAKPEASAEAAKPEGEAVKAEPATAGQKQAKTGEPSPEAAAAKPEKGWIDEIKGMVMGGDDKPETAEPEAAKAPEAQPVAEGETPAKGQAGHGAASDAQASEAPPAAEAPVAPASHG